MQDAVALWQALLGDESPLTVFVGHSMGGAIATWAASRQVSLQPRSNCPLKVANCMLSFSHVRAAAGVAPCRPQRRIQQAGRCMQHASSALLQHHPSCLA